MSLNRRQQLDYSQKYTIISSRVNFAHYVQKRQQIQQGDALGLSLYPPDNDDSITTLIKEGAINTTVQEYDQYLAQVERNQNVSTQPVQPLTLTITQFTTVGTTTWTAPLTTTSVEYLIVGGGGGGGGGYDTGAGGGGGGGMVLVGTLSVVPGTSYTITVGAGGAASTNSYPTVQETDGGIGETSVFDIVTALGGNGGNRSRSQPGGSGVGGLAQNTTVSSGIGGSGGGSAGTSAGGSGGGGGGSSGNGGNGSPSSGGTGGAGTVSNLSGTSITYGIGGAGARGNIATTGANGTINTGRGGGGGGFTSGGARNGGAGGSGIVVLQYYA